MRSTSVAVLRLCTTLLFVACAPRADRANTAAGASGDSVAAPITTPPAPFDKGPVKIALVQYSGAGDYFQQWTKGARAQADAAGFAMVAYDAKADDARQGADMKAAIGARVAGIIVDHGTSPTMCPLINQATDAGIAVVVYDVKVLDCAPKAVETAQNDVDLATLALSQMAKDIGDAVPVGYVNPMVIAPRERRDLVWKQFVDDHRWDQKFAVGKFSHDVADDNAKLATPALKAHPEVKAVFAPYDEVTKGVVRAIEANKLGTRVAAYGIDISNEDITVMTGEDSPWKATATTDPSAIGAAVTRTLALQLAGQLGKRQVVFPGVLVTQSFLRQEQIKNMADLRAKLPALNLGDIASASWLRTVKF
ncbi:MAG: substrate-binding domain-containing protein [Gemmatimonadales bacterium]